MTFFENITTNLNTLNLNVGCHVPDSLTGACNENMFRIHDLKTLLDSAQPLSTALILKTYKGSFY